MRQPWTIARAQCRTHTMTKVGEPVLLSASDLVSLQVQRRGRWGATPYGSDISIGASGSAPALPVLNISA
jgi:hypothetical protein